MRKTKKIIINLYDAPLYPRPSYSSRHLKPAERRLPFLSCCVLAAAALYCVVYAVNGMTAMPAPERAMPRPPSPAVVQVLTSSSVPAPDMSSDGVRRAEADAPPVSAGRSGTMADATPCAAIAAKPHRKAVHVAATPKADDGFSASPYGSGEWRIPATVY
jgi:hypothetical protein